MTSTYRRILRERAAHDDAAFAEYMSDLVFPAYLRELCRFADRHPEGGHPRPARPRQDDRGHPPGRPPHWAPCGRLAPGHSDRG